MNATFTIKEKTGYVYGYSYVRLPSTQPSTFNSDRMVLDAKAVVTEVNSMIRDTHMEYLRTTSLPEIGDDFTDEEDMEWDILFAQPHVQAGLDRLAKEAERQVAAGETEEGGFAVE
ncbi:MAG: hypothetical protein ACR2H5_23495 [Ktedonobacteraceae bacterium]